MTFVTRYTLYDVLGEGDYGTVFKALDRQTDTVVAIKVVAGYPSHNFGDLEGEGSVIKQMNDQFNAFSSSIVVCTDEDHDFSLSELGPYAKHVDVLSGDEGYEDSDDEDAEPHAFYFGMELLKGHLFYSEDLELTPEETLDALFETYMTLKLVETRGWPHEDLGFQNILYKETDEVRSYKINGYDYIVRSRYLPKIIDWSTHVGSHHPSEPK